LRSLLLAAIAIAAFAASVSTAPAQSQGREFYGVTPGLSPTDADIERMGRARVGTLHQVFSWEELQPVPGDDYNFTNFDRIVAGAAEQGIVTLPVLYGTPEWARNCSGVPPRYCDRVTPHISARGRAGWDALLRALVDRYGPMGSLWTDTEDPYSPPYKPITSWQIWTEPNSATYFRPRPSAQAYANLLKGSAAAIRARDPGARILLGGLLGDPPDNGVSPSRFLHQLYRRPGAKDDFDALAINPYSPGLDDVLAQVRAARAISKANGDGAKPIYVTELGWGSGRPGRVDPLLKGSKGQAQMLAASFHALRRSAGRLGIGGVFWFTWRDLSPAAAGRCFLCRSSGLLTSDSVAKAALRTFVRFTGGSV
jgi:hypothetical protein